jgi:S-adenosylmethionine synthetase
MAAGTSKTVSYVPLSIMHLTVAYLNATINSETQNAKPEIGTD